MLLWNVSLLFLENPFQVMWESCFAAVWLVHYLSLRVSGYNSKRPTCKISSGLKHSHGFHWKGLWGVNFGSWIWSMQSFTAEWMNFSSFCYAGWRWQLNFQSKSETNGLNLPLKKYLNRKPSKSFRHLYNYVYIYIYFLVYVVFPFHNFHCHSDLQVCCSSLGFRGQGTCAPSRALAAPSLQLVRRGSFARIRLRHTVVTAKAPSQSYGISTVWNEWLKVQTSDSWGGSGWGFRNDTHI